jgi:hypothetical protein
MRGATLAFAFAPADEPFQAEPSLSWRVFQLAGIRIVARRRDMVRLCQRHRFKEMDYDGELMNLGG